jgi:hypothetical protein
LSLLFAARRSHFDNTAAPTDHAELWVKSDDVEKARAVIRNGSDEDKSLIWWRLISTVMRTDQ